MPSIYYDGEKMVQRKIPIIFILMLVIALTGTLYVGSIYYKNESLEVIRVNYSNYNDVIKYLASKEHLDLSNTTIYYKLLMGGRPVEIKHPLLINKLINIPVTTIHFAVYTRSKGWLELPFIPYSFHIKAVGGEYYKLDRTITANTTIKLRLPPELPITVDPRKNVPWFARGSRGWYVFYIEMENKIKIPIYVFVYSRVRNSLIYTYTTFTDISTAWDTAIETPGIRLLIKYVKNGVVKADDLSQLIHQLHRTPIPFKQISFSSICPPNDPTCNLPNSGGGIVPDKIWYTENWPTALGEKLKLEINTNKTKFLFIRPVNPLNNYWNTVSPSILEMGFTITTVPREKVYEEQVMMVWINDTYLGYSVIPGYEPSISFFYKYYPGTRDINKSYTIVIKIVGSSTISWNITVRNYIVYEIHENFYRDSFKTKFILSPFQESTNPPMYSTILLKDTYNYTYRFLVPIPLPSGGYFNDPDKLFFDENLSFTARLRITSAINNPYRFRIGLCFGTYCVEEKVMLDSNSEKEIEYVRTHDLYFADDILEYSKTDGSIPLVFYIEPIDIPQENVIEVVLRIVNIFPIGLRVVPPLYFRYGPWYREQVIFSTIYHKDYLLQKGQFKDVISTIMGTERVFVYGSINKFCPTLFSAKYSLSSIGRGVGSSIVYMELKPFIPIWSDEEPYSGNYYTEYSPAGIKKLKLEVKLEGASFNPVEVHAYDYDPGVGAYLPDEEELISKILTVIQIGEKVAKYVSKTIATALGALKKLLFIGSIIAYGYDALRSQLINGVSIYVNGDTLRVEFTNAPLNPCPTDKGLVVRANIGHSYSLEKSYAEGYFIAEAQTVVYSSSVNYVFTSNYRLYLPP